MKDLQAQRGRFFFFGLFITLSLLVLYVLSPFLSVIAIAVVTVVMLKPLYDWYLARKWVKERVRVATTLAIVSFFLLILIPIFIVGFLMFSQANDLLEQVKSSELEFSFENLLSTIDGFLRQVPALRDFEIDTEQLAQSLLNLAVAALSWLTSLAASLGTSLANIFIGGLIFLIILATLLPNMDDLEDRIQRLSPMEVNITRIYQLKGRKMVASVIKGVFLLAVIQGLIMGVAYWLAGVPFTILWTLLSMIFALLPLVGISFIVWFMVLIFFLTGNLSSALIVLFAFYVIVNPLDLTLRPKLVSKEAYLNFTLMLLALFGGLGVGGLLGMIYGPVIMVLFVTTIEIYGEYYADVASPDPSLELSETIPAANTDDLVSLP